MAYNKQGFWRAEDDSVANRVTDLTKTNTPYMQAARTDAKKEANRRGLLNSSIAAGAGADAAIRAALPIASQDAAQTHEKNLSSQGFYQQNRLIASAGMQDRATQAPRLRTQKDIAELNASTQKQIADMSISQEAREAATAAVVQMTNQYARAYTDIISNPDIPDDVRSAYLQSMLFNRDSNLNLVEQLSGIDLNWRAPATSISPNYKPAGGGKGFGAPWTYQPSDSE